ncbi:MAG: glycosyltransferase [Mycobacteriales bacterium]
MSAAVPALRDEVTVVVITRDRPQMLRQALRSVLGQRGGPVPVVCVVDGTAGDTLAVLADFPAVQVVRHTLPSGPAAARNAGLAAVRTDWVAFLDDDDVWAPDKLLAQRRALAAAPDARWCHTGAMALTADLAPVGAMRARHSGDVHAAILAANVVCGGGSSVYAHTATVRAVGGFDPDVHRHEDWDLWIRLAAASPLAVVDRPLVGFRRHAASRSGVSVESDAVRLLGRYEDERRRLGVTKISHYPLQAVHDNPVVRGSRLPFARGYIRAGVYHRSPRLLVASVGLLTFPRLLAAASRRRWRHRTPTAWFEEVATWLPPLALRADADDHALDV